MGFLAISLDTGYDNLEMYNYMNGYLAIKTLSYEL